MYLKLAEMYGFTPHEIAEMTYHQQAVFLGGKPTLSFRSMEEFMAWKSTHGR